MRSGSAPQWAGPGFVAAIMGLSLFWFAVQAGAQEPGGGLDTSAGAQTVDVARTPSGKIRRSSHARNTFKRDNPCPLTGRPIGPCPGYVIDHVVALKRGGADQPSNMQWQTTSEAKQKDRWE